MPSQQDRLALMLRSGLVGTLRVVLSKSMDQKVQVTTLTLHAIAECQRRGGIAAFVDAEHAFDRFYAEKLGVNTDELIVSQPDTGEQALEIADNLVRSGAVDILIIDSVAALTPKAEIEGEMGDARVGLQARLMS